MKYLVVISAVLALCFADENWSSSTSDGSSGGSGGSGKEKVHGSGGDSVIVVNDQSGGQQSSSQVSVGHVTSSGNVETIPVDTYSYEHPTYTLYRPIHIPVPIAISQPVSYLHGNFYGNNGNNNVGYQGNFPLYNNYWYNQMQGFSGGRFIPSFNGGFNGSPYTQNYNFRNLGYNGFNGRPYMQNNNFGSSGYFNSAPFIQGFNRNRRGFSGNPFFQNTYNYGFNGSPVMYNRGNNRFNTGFHGIRNRFSTKY